MSFYKKLKKILIFFGFKKYQNFLKISVFLFKNFLNDLKNPESYKEFYIAKKILDNKYIKHEKITPFTYLRSQLLDSRSIDMENELVKQINFFKKNLKNKKDIFTMIEVGNFLGQSLELLGNILHKHIKDNYLIISIDPFKKFSNDNILLKPNSDRIIIGDSVKIDDKFLSEIYYYFMNNISKTKFKNNHIHLRKNASDSLLILKHLNIKADFIYIDANHSYSGIKEDYLNYTKLLHEEDKYYGRISGDDYELSFEEAKIKFDLDEATLNKILKENKERDFIYIDEKKPKYGFHPGITLFFNEINDDITKYESGYWIRNDIS